MSVVSNIPSFHQNNSWYFQSILKKRPVLLSHMTLCTMAAFELRCCDLFPPIPNHSVLCNGDKKHPSCPVGIVGVGGRDRAELPIHDSHTLTLACSTWLIGAWSRDALLPPQIGGQCKCKRHVSGRQCNQCQHGFYKLQSAQADGCRACNCNTAGTVQPDITCHQDSGQCQCKANVIGTYQAALRPPSLFRSLLPSFSSSLSNFFFQPFSLFLPVNSHKIDKLYRAKNKYINR